MNKNGGNDMNTIRRRMFGTDIGGGGMSILSFYYTGMN